MRKKVDCSTYVNLLRTVNLHIFLPRLTFIYLELLPSSALLLCLAHLVFIFCLSFVALFFRQILHFLGNEGPKTSDPSKYIRYIYNRVILENATVRASAVSTLAKFGALVDSLKVILHLPSQIIFKNDHSLTKNVMIFAAASHIYPIEALPF